MAIESKEKLTTVAVTNERLERKTRRRSLLHGQMKATAEKKLFDLMKEQNPNIKDIEKLISDGVDLHCRNEQGRTPLLQLLCNSASKQNVQQIVGLFVQNGAELNAKDNNGSNSLHWLCCSYRGSDLIDVARLLLQNEVDVNAKTNNGYNALHLLCTSYKGNDMLDIVRLLIENGVDFNGRNVNGKKACDYLISNYQGAHKNEIKNLLG